MPSKVKYRIGWPDFNGIPQGANEITGPGEDGKRTGVLAIRFGCSCCRNSADNIDDLTTEEREMAEVVVKALNKWAEKVRRKKSSVRPLGSR